MLVEYLAMRRPPDEDNGILALVTGDIIAGGSNGLPLAESSKKGDSRTAEATLHDGTRVMLYYVVMQYTRHRSTHRWWGCHRAEEI